MLQRVREETNVFLNDGREEENWSEQEDNGRKESPEKWKSDTIIRQSETVANFMLENVMNIERKVPCSI